MKLRSGEVSKVGAKVIDYGFDFLNFGGRKRLGIKGIRVLSQS
jgi:hypothetical protein